MPMYGRMMHDHSHGTAAEMDISLIQVHPGNSKGMNHAVLSWYELHITFSK